LANDEGRYRLLVENITDYAIYMVDTNGLVASWNQGAERFKGYTASEIIGQHFSCFYTEEDRATGLPARALAMARTEGKFEQEGWRVRKDRSRFWAIFVIEFEMPTKTLSGMPSSREI
jgi:PAS domain S-box-containing protein